MKYNEAVRYAQSLIYIDFKRVFEVDELPENARLIIENCLSLESKPDFILPNSEHTSLTDWLVETIGELDGEELLFKSDSLYWKYWLDIIITNYRSFLNQYLSTSSTNEFYLINPASGKVCVLLNEEYQYCLFIKYIS
ncbi:MAG: hypothetical protein EOO61_07630 [Hymenobacter sp.]|nr:MAG: hypothetical protein EOO61_07630 [Hymenobacter sp.]